MFIDKTHLISGGGIDEEFKRSLAQQIEPHVREAYEQAIMDIFYRSDFYEPNSCNETLRSQHLPVTEQALRELKGTQFVVSECLSVPVPHS